MANKTTEKSINITLVRSKFGILKNQKANLDALGLHKIGQTKTFADNACVRGKIEKVSHLKGRGNLRRKTL